MIRLQNKSNVAAPDATYPYGNIKNDISGDGTPVDVQVYGDVHQFLERMFALSGLISNNLPDNATNGFQLYDAFSQHIAGGMPFNSGGVWLAGGTSTVTVISGVGTTGSGSVTVDSGDFVVNKYKVIGRTLVWQLVVKSITITAGVTTISCLLPAGLAGYKFSNPGVAVPGVFNTTTSMLCTAGFNTSSLPLLNLDRFVHLELTSGSFPTGTNNQYFSFSIVAEIEPV